MITTIMTTADTILVSFGILAIIAFIIFIAKVIYNAKNHTNDIALSTEDYARSTDITDFVDNVKGWIHGNIIKNENDVDCYEFHNIDKTMLMLLTPKTPENDFKYMIKINKAETFERWAISEQEEYFENIEDCIKFANSFNA